MSFVSLVWFGLFFFSLWFGVNNVECSKTLSLYFQHLINFIILFKSILLREKTFALKIEILIMNTYLDYLNVYISNYFLAYNLMPCKKIAYFCHWTRNAATSLVGFFLYEFCVKDYTYVYVYTLDFKKPRRLRGFRKM